MGICGLDQNGHVLSLTKFISKEDLMAQSTSTPRPTTPTPTPTPTPTSTHPPAASHTPPTPAPPAPRPMPVPVAPMVTDRNLVEQLRNIYQTANRHEPVPSGTHLSKVLLDALEEVADIASKAVKDYKPE
jgi:hypothetical protein